MGNLFTSVYIQHPEISKWQDVFEMVGLADRDVARLYDEYRLIDTDTSHSINLQEMLNFIGIEKTYYSKRVFSIFDSDGSGAIDFGEFVTSMWNYCTLDKNDLISFSFDMYDANNSGEIDASEVIQLMQDVYGKNLTGNIHAQAVLNKLSKSNNTFSAMSFAEFASKNPALLYPAFMAQEKLQSEIMGFGFWRRITAVRDKQKDKVNMTQIRHALFRCKHQMKRRASSIIFRRASATITRMMSSGFKSMTSPKKPKKSDEKPKPVSKKGRSSTVVKRVSPVVASVESKYLKLEKVDANHHQQQLATDRSISISDSTNTAPALSSHNTSHFNYDKY